MTKHRLPLPEPSGQAPTAADAPTTRLRRGLDRAVLAALARGLIVYFDEVRRQEVPERFKLLLETDVGDREVG